ncbi:MAG: DUF2062 domain-containing protein [Pyrinomonadaceae bacterium]|nr:DUF2062 domain-containing protein [Pyrinomonadaceae bacterium]
MFPATFRGLLAIDDPPERTALAFSIGVFIAFSPFLGLHTIAATLIAFLFRFNKIAIYAGTFLNNPFLTLMPITVASYALGAFVLGRPLSIPAEGVELIKNPRLFSGDYYHLMFVQSWYMVESFALGATLLSVICSLLAYPLTLWLLRKHHQRKQESP